MILTRLCLHISSLILGLQGILCNTKNCVFAILGPTLWNTLPLEPGSLLGVLSITLSLETFVLEVHILICNVFNCLCVLLCVSFCNLVFTSFYIHVK